MQFVWQSIVIWTDFLVVQMVPLPTKILLCHQDKLWQACSASLCVNVDLWGYPHTSANTA